MCISDVDFSDCKFIGGSLFETSFRNVSFARATFELPEKRTPWVLTEGEFWLRGKNLDTTDTFFKDGIALFISGKDFMKTRNYKERKLDFCLSGYDFSDTDLSGLAFYGVTFYETSGARMQGANLSGMAFKSATIYPGISAEQLQSTWNYQVGLFHKVAFCKGSAIPADMRKKCFIDTYFETDVSHVDFTDAKLIECRFPASSSITLAQLKSTWNYKTGRMDLITYLPPELQAELDAEKKSE